MRVRLIRKFAEEIDGVDLSAHKVGDALELNPSQGRLLIAEEWAILERRAVDRGEHAGQQTLSGSHAEPPRAAAADSASSSKSRRKSRNPIR
jgi:hypothetical protein